MTGSDGCNQFVVPYVGDLQIEKVMEATDTYAELPALSFGEAASQRTTCSTPAGVMEQEAAFFSMLPNVAYYFKVGGSLLLLDAEGTPLAALSGRNQ